MTTDTAATIVDDILDVLIPTLSRQALDAAYADDAVTVKRIQSRLVALIRDIATERSVADDE